MMAVECMIEWASQQASSLLAPLGNRWLHVQGVVKKAEWVGQLCDEDEYALLVAAAYLHDIGYAPSLAVTGFHPLDGARYLQIQGKDRLASLVAHHSEAEFEAQLYGLSTELAKFPREHSVLADALTYCDMTTNSLGQQITFQERIQDILRRYHETHIVHEATLQALPSLSQAVERTQQLLHKHGLT